MKTRIIKCASVITILLTSQTAFGYEDEKVEVDCKKPKFTDFSLKEYHDPEKIEVPAETAFEFKVSAWSDPETIRLTGRKEKIPFTVESNSSFHRIIAQLPASMTGKFVRIDAAVKALLGCEEKKGWLIKVAEGAAAAPEPSAKTPAPAQSDSQEQTSSIPADSSKPEAPASKSPDKNPAPNAEESPASKEQAQ